MKKIIFVAFAIVGMTFASCGNGKATEETTECDSTNVDTVEVVDTLSVDTFTVE